MKKSKVKKAAPKKAQTVFHSAPSKVAHCTMLIRITAPHRQMLAHGAASEKCSMSDYIERAIEAYHARPNLFSNKRKGKGRKRVGRKGTTLKQIAAI